MKVLFVFDDYLLELGYKYFLQTTIKDKRFTKSLIYSSHDGFYLKNKIPIDPARSRALYEQWDLIVVHDSMALKQYHKLFPLNPLVFVINQSTKISIPLVSNNLTSVLELEDCERATYAVPLEIIKRLKIPTPDLVFPSCRETPEKEIKTVLYICEAHPINELSIILKIIQGISPLHDVKLCIISEYFKYRGEIRKVNALLKEICQKKITYLKEQLDYKNYDLVIARALSAKVALSLGCKTIIIGDSGFGGLVTKANLKLHLAFGFKGRPGGNLKETIPNALFKEEIQQSLSFKEDIPDTGNINEAIFSEITETINDLFKHFSDTITLFQDIENNDRICRLYPKMASNILFKIDNGDILLVSLPYYKIIGSITHSMMELLQEMDGTQPMSNYIKGNPFLEENIPFIRTLWQNKILLFNH